MTSIGSHMKQKSTEISLLLRNLIKLSSKFYFEAVFPPKSIIVSGAGYTIEVLPPQLFSLPFLERFLVLHITQNPASKNIEKWWRYCKNTERFIRYGASVRTSL
jgi:hypothetical protein